MSATRCLSGRPTVLVIHDDGDALDLLTRLFEASGFEVVTAVTGFRAQAHLESERPIDVVVAPWDANHPVGGERLSLVAPAALRPARRFVFIAAEVPPEFDRDRRGPLPRGARWSRPAEIVRVAVAVVKRRAAIEAARAMPVTELDREPTDAAARRGRAGAARR